MVFLNFVKFFKTYLFIVHPHITLSCLCPQLHIFHFWFGHPKQNNLTFNISMTSCISCASDTRVNSLFEVMWVTPHYFECLQESFRKLQGSRGNHAGNRDHCQNWYFGFVEVRCLPPSGNPNLSRRGEGINKCRHRWAVRRQSHTHKEHHVVIEDKGHPIVIVIICNLWNG